MRTILRRTLRTVTLTLATALAAGAASAATVDVFLRAERWTKTLPGGSAPMWVFADCGTDATFTSCSPSAPGPRITAAAGDTLNINVRNDLSAPVSIVIPGQSEGGTPVVVGGRVRSFTSEVAAGATGVYSWASLKAGTFLYQSGTQPSIQVPMGLYGAVVVNDPAAYPGVAYAAESLLVFSEIDAVQNTAVDAAADEAGYPSTIAYNPKYFLVNGVAFDSASPASSTFDAGTGAGTLLLRLANAGLRTHVAAVVGLEVEVHAEDGNLYPTPLTRSAVVLPAGKTHDAVAAVVADRTYAVYDRMLDLTNNDAPDGGMLAYLQVGAGSVEPPGGGAAVDDAYDVSEDVILVQGAPGVLGNDGGLSTASVVVEPKSGTLTLNADGSFSYEPNPDFAGQDAFVYLASDGSSSSTATVHLTVTATNDAPLARDDAYRNTFGATLTVAAPGVLANDGDPEGDAITAVPLGGFSGLNADGSISYAGGPVTFQYQAQDANGALSDPVTVTLEMLPVRGLTLNVVGVEPNGTTSAVADYRWLVEEDATWHADPGNPTAPGLGTNFHRSHMPVVAQGCAGGGCAGGAIGDLALDPAKHYYVSVLPRSAGSGSGHTNGGAPLAPGATQLTVYVNRQPLPPAQISVFVFEDNAPTNGAPDGNEIGLGGFQIVLEDAGGRYGQNGGPMLTDKDGALLTNAKAGTAGCPASVSSTPGVILTCPDGTAIIGNLAPGKYGVSVVPPDGSTEGWVQTSTIEGTKVNDAWVKAGEPAYFQEFGPPGYHVFTGFVSPSRLVKPGGGSNTVSGTVTNLHMSRPPDQSLWDAGTNDAMAHTTAWVGLNSANGTGPNIAAVKAGSDGSFSIGAVPNGTYQLVVWDAYLDQIIAYRTLTLPGGGSLGNVPVFQWFSRLEHNVFLDTNQNGVRDGEEAPLIEQNINIRFRDGSIYQAFPTDHTGFVPFDQVFPFFNWMVAEVDYARFKPTGVTVTVDGGGDVAATGNVLNPQIQLEDCTDPSCTSRTETGPQLVQAFQGFIGQTSVLDWGKAPYQPGENGGISGVVYYASTRAENNPRLGAADPWEPGIPSVKVRLYREVAANGGGTALALVDEVETDSWDESLPTGCPGADPGDAALLGPGEPLTKCYDGMRNWNQVRPGVFDGGYAFNDIPPGKYIVEVVPPEGFELMKEEDKNVDFGDAYQMAPAALMLPGMGLVLALPDQAMVADALAALEPEPGILQPPCVGAGRIVPPYLTLFEDQMIEAPYAGSERPLCDRKEVVLSDQSQAAADFFLFTSTPIASHFTGMVLDDLSQEFDPNSPQFGEKWAPPFVPVSVRDWTGRELSRSYADRWGRINGLVPSTFTANVPSPSGYAPNMVMTCMNDPGPIPNPTNPTQSITDPYYDPRYSNFCYTFQYMPGTTTYLDTPVLPVAAFAAGDNPVDCAFPDGTPVIRQVNGNEAPGPFVNPGPPAGQAASPQLRHLTILSAGTVQVPNPAYDGPTGTQPRTIARDYGFGACPTSGAGVGQVTLDGAGLSIFYWDNDRIEAVIPVALTLQPGTRQLMVTRCPAAGGRPSLGGITVTSSYAAADQPIRVSAGQSISDAIAAAPAGALVLVEPGSYDELVVMAKPVRLQGSGAGSTIINAVKRPAEKLNAWRARIDALVASGAIDPLPGQEFGAGDLEPDTLGTEEGAGITVLAPNPANAADPRWENRFRPSSTSPYFVAARIDGLGVTGGDTGGGIFVNGWAHSLSITNNKVYGNQGFHHGGIRVGRPFLQDLAPQIGPYGFNNNVRVAYNTITQNGALDGSGGGGLEICSGSDNYTVFLNWICGNFSEGHGGGIAHFGRSDNGQISRNGVLFNQSFSQGLTRSGGGIYVGGEPPAAGGLTIGSGRNLVIDGNLIQGNHAGAGHGGGVRLEMVNGADLARTPACNLGGNASALDACYQVGVANNMIVDNVAGWSGGGLSMLDAARVIVAANTIAHNDSTATVGAVFSNPNTSTPQPAGLSSEPHSAALAALVPGTANDFSNPLLVNNIVWQNRAFYYDQSGGTGLIQPNLSGPPLSCPTGADHWDLGVLGNAFKLSPSYSILTDLVSHGQSYAGSNNIASDPQFVSGYCNGTRSALLVPEVTTLVAAPALDEGGNFIDVRYGPISLSGDYHIGPTSPARSNGNASLSPGTDYDTQPRPQGPGYDRGADERP